MGDGGRTPNIVGIEPQKGTKRKQRTKHKVLSTKIMNLYKYASPATFYPLAGKMIPWFAIPSAILFVAGLYVGFFIAPTDFQQGDAYRIILFTYPPRGWACFCMC